MNFNNRFKIILSGICALTNQQKSIEIKGREKKSFKNFLGGHQFKIVRLDKVLGIGGEGVVIEKELEIKVMEGTYSYDGSRGGQNFEKNADTARYARHCASIVR